MCLIALRDFFLFDNFDLNYSNLSDQDRHGARMTKNAFDSTSDSAYRMNRVSMLFHTFIRMSPYLNQQEMKDVLESMNKGKSLILTEEEQNWLSLFHSVVARNAQSMVAIGEPLLFENESGLPGYPKEYLVSTVMIGYILQDKTDNAQIIWNRFKDDLSSDPRSIMLFRFLEAQCQKLD